MPCFMSPDISGTYNNQYMVLDLKRVKPKHSLDTETLYVVEQIPSYVEFSDQTDVLRKGTFFILQAGSMISMCVSMCVYLMGSVWRVDVLWGSMWWEEQGTSAGYTGRKLPGSAQRVKPAPHALM